MDDGPSVEQLRNRIHVVEGLLRVLDGWPDFTTLVFLSSDRRSAVASLMSEWQLSEAQASYAVDLPVSRSTALSRKELTQELTSLHKALGDHRE